MAALSLNPLTDLDTLNELYRDPYIARVGHDHRPASPIIHPEVRYLGAHVDGQLAGAFLIIESGYIECDMHVLLRRWALPYSRALGHLCLAEIFSNPLMQRVTGYVIEGLDAAKNYGLKIGFRIEGFRRDAVIKSGALLGLYILGITRKDWENLK